MGYRHMVVVDGELTVVGMITRTDMNEHSLHHFWEESSEQLQNDMKVDTLPPAIVYEIRSPPRLTDGLGAGAGGGAGGGGGGGLMGGMRSRSGSVQSDRSGNAEEELDDEIVEAYRDVSDSPKSTLRKTLVPAPNP